ncbi:RCC1 domain-containing protein [Corallococcus terminator]|uniref:RTX toxin n=1 Tax=Corallococcus terminator TaxID=2316733 RepID=A0A3A8J2C4_9BACT|nr:RTX toxin [Corallococcus terminator]RKG83683.1 RTX toxin [Corallococcus terminator]
MQRTSPRWFRSRGVLGALLLSLSAPWVVGCSSGTTAPPDTTSQQQNQSEVSVSIGAQDIFAEAVKQGRVSALAFSYADVASIRVDVAEQGVGGAVIFKNFDLFTSAGAWTGTLPFLPKGKALTFSARALNAAGTLLFEGSLDATLNLDHETVTIPLAPANNNAVIALPRIRRISIPSAFASAQSGNITFAVEATNGEALRYAITSAVAGSGSFSPLNGAITLQNTAGAFVSQYTPPTVSTETVFAHTVTVTNAAGHSVSTTFTTKVKPNETSSGVIDTTVAVLFNPVINGLNGLRVRETGNVIFTADVSDDGAQEALSYAWSFTPASGTTPAPVPAFTGATNPSTLQNYTTAVQGDLKLAVTDGNNGTTTLTYKLTPDQFPDNPVAEGPLSGINTIRGGDNHTCAMLNDGSVRCWGHGAFGQLGYENTQNIGDNELPHIAGEVKLLGKATKLAVGGNHTCALLDTGLVRCWGQNTYGQLGYNSKDNVGDGEPVASFGYVNLGGPAIRIAVGGEHSCAVMATGKVRCWGRNHHGQLGYGHTNSIGDDEQPWKAGDVNIGDVTATDVVAGAAHTCALLSNEKMLCWGYNLWGQLGQTHALNIGGTELPGSAQQVTPGGPVSQITAGINHTCALLKTGTVRCWGANSSGQMGTGQASGAILLKDAGPIDLGTSALQVSAGGNHSCALLSTGSVRCWGLATYGQTGYGSTTARNTPGAAVDLDGATAYQVATSSGNHTCALLSTGKARCWGQGNSGQLGYSSTNHIGDNEQPSAAGDIQLLPPTP